MKLSRKNLTVAAGVSALVLLLGACSSTSPAAPDTAVGTNVATGEPIAIGAYAPNSGPAAWPEVGWGVKAAEWYINNELGGINGSPLEIHTCDTNGSAESGVSCANEFVSAGYPVVLDSYDPTTGAGRPILAEAGIPWAGSVAGDGTNEKAPYPEGFYFTGPLAVTAAGLANIWEERGVKRASVALTDAPAFHLYIDNTLIPLAKALGVDLTVQYIDPTNANWSAIAAAQLQNDPDMTGSVSLPEESCTELFAALRQQDPDGDIFVGSCSQYIGELGDLAAGTLTVPRLWSALAVDHAPAAVREEIEAFAAAMTAIGHGEALEARASYAFAAAVTIAKALTTIDGDITAESVAKALSSITDEQMFLGPRITCDGEQWPGVPTACSSQSIYFEVQADGTLKPGNPDGFVDLSQTIIDTLS